jgi:1-acyl-sn-glycerol-3-phosphate acyltransferase
MSGTAEKDAVSTTRGQRVWVWIVRLLFGESLELSRAGLPGMPKPFLPWYLVSAGVAKLFFLIWTKWERVGTEHIPRGGVLMVSNHVASADPPMLAAALYPRWTKFMAKIELFRKPRVGRLFAMSGAFPVRRFNADLRALREAERLLAAGEVLGMFPEGHRSDTGGLLEGHPGTALIALRSRAPIIPVAITGSEQLRRGWRVFLQRPRVRVVFGEPFYLEASERVDREAVQRAHERIMWEIAARLPAQYRGVYRERFSDLPDEAQIEVPPPG